jgi:RHS repeat-associated protein
MVSFARINPSPLTAYDRLRWRDADANPATGLEETLYYTNDANMNVTALVDASSGNVVERYVYTPYGEATVLAVDWSPVTNNESAVANEVMYCGYGFDAETGMYSSRIRTTYHPTLARWLQRDIPYIDGTNLYQYCRSNPANMTDPAGLQGFPMPGGTPTMQQFTAKAMGVPTDADLAEWQKMGDLYNAIGGASASALQLGALLPLDYASALLSNWLERGGDKYFGPTDSIAADIVRDPAIHGVIRKEVLSLADGIGVGETVSRTISGTGIPLTLTTGGLSLALGQAYLRYVADLTVTKRCTSMKRIILEYTGALAGEVTDKYNFEYRPKVSGPGDLLNNMGYYTQESQNIPSFRVTVQIMEDINDSVEVPVKS